MIGWRMISHVTDCSHPANSDESDFAHERIIQPAIQEIRRPETRDSRPEVQSPGFQDKTWSPGPLRAIDPRNTRFKATGWFEWSDAHQPEPDHSCNCTQIPRSRFGKILDMWVRESLAKAETRPKRSLGLICGQLH